MVLNSTVTVDANSKETHDDNSHHLVVNTTDFNNRDFDEFVAISEEIERNNRQRRSQRRSRNNTMVATMTREELFESTNVDDDQFLNALEHQNSYEPATNMNKTVLLNSIDNLMKYFDEDVNVGDSSLKVATPTKIKTKGKVASAVASFRSKAGSLTPSPLSKRKNKQKLEVKTSIQELKKCYELSPETDNTSKSPSMAKLSPKLLRKSKVKQMAMLFNTKMHSIIRKDSPEPRTPEPLSPGLESLSSPNFTSTLKPKSPKFKPKMPTFIAKLPSPKPSPLFKRRQMQKAPSTSSLSSAASPATKRKQLQRQPSTTCLVAENVFSQLSVKDKALLYNKFIEDMSKQNPKFSKHGQVLESTVQKAIARGEVICEKQGTVKNIRDTLEAKFTPTKALSKTLQRFKRSPADLSLNITPIPKSKEFEDILKSQRPETPSTPGPDESDDFLHVSTLTVVLKPSPESKKYATKPRTNRKKRDVRFRTDLGGIEPSFKRTQEMIRSSVNIEPFAPPKKIRRTQHERLAPKMFFQNQNLEKLFYNWLKEKNGVVFDITPVHNKDDVIEIVPKNSRDNVIPKHKVDQLLEEAINKLDSEKGAMPPNMEENAINLIKATMEEEKSLEKSVIEVELPLEVELNENESKIKESSMENGEMALTSMNKTTSEYSLTELAAEGDSQEISPDSSLKLSSSKPLRKKKLRRSLTWKKDNSLVETNPILSTDSDSDCKSLNNKSLNFTLPKSKKCSAYVKKLLFKTINSSISSEQTTGNATAELSILELDRSLIRQINSPTKIKTAYTLTVMSSPSPPTESDFCDSDLPSTPVKDVSRSWPSLLEACLEEEDDKRQLKNKSVSTEFTDLAKNKLELDQHRAMVDSFIDQGFETGSNDVDSPIRLPRKSPALALNAENPKNFSTPNKDKPLVQIFTAQVEGKPMTAAQQHLISPIPSNTPMHRKNLPMHAIKEDCSSEDSPQLNYTPSSYNESASYFSTDTTHNPSVPPILGVTHKMESSQFWISTGDFTAALNIHFYESERLMLLSDIFAQKCMEKRDMTFGIDDQKFSLVGDFCSEELLKKIPKVKNCSQYWFSTGDVLLPFAGKQMSTQKIQTFFDYLREFMDEESNGALRFGIDTYEFSNIDRSPTIREFQHTWSSGTPIKTSDLDQSDFESVELEQSLTFSALGSNQSDSGSLKSEELIQPNNQTYSTHDETDHMEQIFEDARHLNLSKTHTDKLALESQFTVPEMLKTLQNQQHKLKCLEERMLNCAQTGSVDKGMEQFNESPEYMRKLRSIISAIDNIGRGNGFNACSIEQLESFMFFLSRYADLCLANCTAHIEKILDVVMNQRSFQA